MQVVAVQPNCRPLLFTRYSIHLFKITLVSFRNALSTRRVDFKIANPISFISLCLVYDPVVREIILSIVYLSTVDDFLPISSIPFISEAAAQPGI